MLATWRHGDVRDLWFICDITAARPVQEVGDCRSDSGQNWLWTHNTSRRAYVAVYTLSVCVWAAYLLRIILPHLSWYWHYLLLYWFIESENYQLSTLVTYVVTVQDKLSGKITPHDLSKSQYPTLLPEITSFLRIPWNWFQDERSSGNLLHFS